MKLSTVLFASTAAAAALEARQACKMPAAPAAIYRKNAQRKYFPVGTYTLKGNPNADKVSGCEEKAMTKVD
jgi:hypothetical protein